MDLIDMTTEERYSMMRKRHKFLHDMVKTFTSLEDFAKEKEEWFALVGDDLGLGEKFAIIDMFLDYGEYETYFIIPDGCGHLTVSEVLLWQDDWCCTSFMNIFTLKNVDEEEILSAIHDYSGS